MSTYSNIVGGTGLGIKVATGLGLAAKLPFLTNPWTAAAMGVATLAPVLKNALNIGTAHLKANDIVQNVENPFGQALGQISSGGSLDDLKSAYNDYLTGVKQFQDKGGDYAKVAQQSLTNPKLWQTFNSVWGQLGGGTAPNPGTDISTISTNNNGNFNFGNANGNSFDVNSFLSNLFKGPGNSGNNSGANGGGMNFGDLSSLFSGSGSDGSGGFDWSKLLDLGSKGINAAFPSASGGSGGISGTGGAIPPWMKYLLPILTGGAGALSNRPSITTATSTSTPNLPQNAQDLRTNIVGQYQDLLSKDPNLSGYESSQLDQMNQGFDAQKTQLAGTLAAKGITGPAAETALQNLENQRFSQGTQFRNQIPLLQTQLKSNILGSALSGFTGLLPSYGATNKGSTTTPGNILGGGLTGASQALALLLGMGAFNQKPTT